MELSQIYLTIVAAKLHDGITSVYAAKFLIDKLGLPLSEALKYVRRVKTQLELEPDLEAQKAIDDCINCDVDDLVATAIEQKPIQEVMDEVDS